METVMKRLVMIAANLVVLLSLTQCSESSSGPDEAKLDPPVGFSISNPVLLGARNQTINGNEAFAEEANDVTYLSASPGTFSNVASVSISNRTTNAPEIVVQVSAGGFDPVAVSAHAGDELLLKAITPAGTATSFSVKVPPKRPPRVVRTSPSKGGIDIALNVQVIVVFSEPIASSSVSGSTIRLVHNGQSVSGTLRFSDDGLKVSFTPSGPLEPLSSYSVVVGTGIHDADGEGLESETTAPFTTENQQASGFGNISGTLVDSATGVMPAVALPLITATPLSGGSSVTFGNGSGSTTFASGALTAGQWRLAIKVLHGWTAVFPGLNLYRDTSVTVNVVAGQTTVVPNILLRPRAPVILVGVNSCPFSLPDPPSLGDWDNCDGGYWGGAQITVVISGVAGTATEGEEFVRRIGYNKYVWPASDWRDNAWSTAIDVAIPGDYDVTLVDINQNASAPTPPHFGMKLVPWETAARRVKATGPLAYEGFDFSFH